jgi:glycosyltransferase involved in cell wall biosynthesis
LAQRVSIIIPTFNRADLLCETIDSVVPQVSAEDEIIVVDDGSTDHTRSAAAGYGQRVRYIWRENGGEAKARNTGFLAAGGEYLLFLDSDDLLMESAVERLLSRLDNEKDAPLAYGPSVKFTSKEAHPQEPPDQADVGTDAWRLTRRNFVGSPGCAMIRRSAIESGGLWDSWVVPHDDWDMWLRLSLLGKFAREDRPVLRYRVHPGNLSLNRPIMLRSWNRLVIKQSSLFSPLRRNREVWKVFRQKRPSALHREFVDCLRQYLAGEESLRRVLSSSLKYSANWQAPLYLGSALRRRVLHQSAR